MYGELETDREGSGHGLFQGTIPKFASTELFDDAVATAEFIKR
jgi:hypothetical protein